MDLKYCKFNINDKVMLNMNLLDNTYRYYQNTIFIIKSINYKTKNVILENFGGMNSRYLVKPYKISWNINDKVKLNVDLLGSVYNIYRNKIFKIIEITKNQVILENFGGINTNYLIKI